LAVPEESQGPYEIIEYENTEFLSELEEEDEEMKVEDFVAAEEKEKKFDCKQVNKYTL
jgi:hypothetical protein